MKLAICIPSSDTVHTDFMLSLLELCTYLNKSQIEYSLHNYRSSVIAESRNQLVKQSFGADYILWLDSDMTFPANILELLLAHDKEIVACNYKGRQFPHRGSAYIITDGNFLDLTETQGLHKVDATGLGICLVNTKIFSLLDKPWFQHYYLEEFEHLAGEDMYFCKKCIEAGIDIFIDADASKHIGHIGTNIYRL